MVVWKPKNYKKTRMWDFKCHIENAYQKNFKNYFEFHAWSIQNISEFWHSLANYFSLGFTTPLSQVMLRSDEFFETKWFTKAKLNFGAFMLENAHNEDKPALIAVDEQGNRQITSFKELKETTYTCANALSNHGLVSGCRVAALMPNITNTVIAMLATSLIGSIWAACSPEFGAEAIIDRLIQIQPKILFTVDCYQYNGKIYDLEEKINKIVKAVSSIELIIITAATNFSSKIDFKNVIFWQDLIKQNFHQPINYFPFSHPLYILFSSGTTGKPKCIVHGAGGTLLQHLKELALHTNLNTEDILFFYTTPSWMMWNWMLSALALGTTLVLFDGCPTFCKVDLLFEFIEAEKITVFGTSAKYLSLLEKSEINLNEKYNLTNLHTILSTGSPLLDSQYDYVYKNLNPSVQLSSISGGTDIISCFALGNPLLPIHKGEIQSLGLGMDVKIYDDAGRPVINSPGELVCCQPFPSMPLCFWNDPLKEAYKRAYFERFNGVWTHGDFAKISKHQGLVIYGRSDTVLNPGGVRIGTAEIYRQVEQIPEILESVVVGQKWNNDERMVLFLRLKDDFQLDQELIKKIKNQLKHHASPRHVPELIIQVPEIPKTINGKILEITIKQLINNLPVTNTQAIINPQCLKFYQNNKALQN